MLLTRIRSFGLNRIINIFLVMVNTRTSNRIKRNGSVTRSGKVRPREGQENEQQTPTDVVAISKVKAVANIYVSSGSLGYILRLP